MFVSSFKILCRRSAAAISLFTGFMLQPDSVVAQSTTADEMASCNASFHINCVDSILTVDFSGSAAPFHGIGDHPFETVVLMGLAVIIFLLKKSKNSRQKTSNNPS